MSARPSWDQYFMTITRQVAERSTCLRAKVGAVIVRDRSILATGYNGAPAGMPHCTEVGCLIYETHTPCIHCLKVLINTGIRTVYYGKEYKLHTVTDLLKPSKIKLVQVPEDVGNA